MLHSNHLQVLCLCVHMLLTLLQDADGTCWSFSCWSAFVSSYGIVLCHIQWEQLQLMVQLMPELSCAQVLYKCIYLFPNAPNSTTVMKLDYDTITNDKKASWAFYDPILPRADDILLCVIKLFIERLCKKKFRSTNCIHAEHTLLCVNVFRR